MPYAENDGVRIHYRTVGEGPPLMMVHGLSNAMFEFGAYVGPLSKDYRLVMVDVRGHGRSDKLHSPEHYGSKTLAGDLVTILDDLGIDTTHYFGYSMGTLIGMYAMVPHASQRLRSLIFGGGPPMLKTESGAELLALIGSLQAPIWERAVEKGMADHVAELEQNAGFRLPEEVRSAKLNVDPQAILALLESMPQWEDITTGKMDCDLPALVFAGDQDELHDMAKETAAALTSGRFVSLPGLNHVEPMWHPEVVVPKIRSFLAAVEGEA